MPTCPILRVAAAVAIASALFVPPLLAQPSLSISGTTATEGNTGSVQAVVTVTLTPASGGVVTVNFESSPATPPATGGTACIAGIDFVNPLGTVRFDPGVVSQTIAVALCGDTADEPDEKFRVRLVRPVGATIATSQGVVTILDDDTAAPLPTISLGDETTVEGNSTAFFLLSLSSRPSQPFTVTVRVESQTATGAAACLLNIDYVQPAPFTFSPLDSDAEDLQTVIELSICGDTVDEPDEIYQVVLSNPVGAILGDSVGLGKITDDDAAAPPQPPLPILSISDVTLAEGNAGARNPGTVTATLSSPSDGIITVGFQLPFTVSNACGTDADMAATRRGTLTFNPGSRTQTIPFTSCGDTTDEPNESFPVLLLNPIGATLRDAVALITIVDDDGPAPPPAPPARTLAITPQVSVTEPRQGAQGFAVFSVTLSGPTATVSVQFATAPVTARAGLGNCFLGGDYLSRAGTLTFSPGIRTREVAVPICTDRVTEGPETFTVTLSSPVNAAITAATGTATIQ